jgi:hypothetical protein
MSSTGNGWPVVDVRTEGSTIVVYLRIPRELQSPCDGCSCAYCTAHPAEIPAWDTLAVCAERGDHSWTVHMPAPPPMTREQHEARNSRRAAAERQRRRA